MAAPDSPVPSATAVITVSFRSEQVLPGFLMSVRGAGRQQPDVLVADNDPDPRSSVESVVVSAGGRYLPLRGNLGYGGAINRAARVVRPDTEWLLISNPDVVLGRGCLDILLETASADPSIGSVGPAIFTSEGTRYPSARAVPSLRTGIGHALFANLWASNPWTRAYHNDRDTTDAGRDAGWLSGACLLVRRSAFESIGGFDEDFFMYFEDVDFGDRLGRAGFRNVYEPRASVVHSGAHSTTSESAAMIGAHHDSARRFLGKRYPGAALWPVRFVAGVGLAVRSALIRRRMNA